MCLCRNVTPFLSEEQQKQLRYKKEQDLLSYYGLSCGYDYELVDVEVLYQDNIHSVHAFVAGPQDKPALLMLHGYGGSHIHYSRMYKLLMKDYHIISVDLPGMGYCSKDNILINNATQALEYFIGIIIGFIQKIIPDKQLYLIGHSFGGYIAAQLALRIQYRLNGLFLLSPGGITRYSDQEIQNLQDLSKHSFLRRQFLKMGKSRWESQSHHLQLYQQWYGSFFIKIYLKKRMQLEGQEYELWWNYIEELLKLPEGSEKSIFLLLHFPRVFALEQESIEFQFEQNQQIEDIPIYFYYGASDWMDQHGANRLVDNHKNMFIREISNAGHQLNFENPQEVANSIMSDIQTIKNRSQQIQ